MQKRHLIGYPIVTLVAFGIGAAGSSPTSASTTTASPAPAATATAATATVTAPASTVTITASPDSPAATAEPATVAKPAAIPGDGTYEIGVDIQPGKYASDTPASGNCYWARLKSDDPFDGILANHNSSGKSVVVIKKSDKYFTSSGCADWEKR